MRLLTLTRSIAAVLLTSISTISYAADVHLGDYVALPKGMNLALWYQQYTHADQFAGDNGPTFNDDTSLKANISLLRLIHYTEIGGHTVNLQTIIPAGNIYDIDIGGNHVEGNSGIGDPIVGGTYWFINEPSNNNYGRYVALTGLVYVPVGSYDKDKPINLGENRWRGDFQLGWIEPIGKKSALEMHWGLFVYSDNDDYLGDLTLEEDPMFNFQGNYVYQLSSVTKLGIGYAGYWGGKIDVEGQYIDQKTEYGQIRLEYQRMMLPTLQFAGQVVHDIHVEGGFRKDYGINLRLAYIF